jgi:hypothetical protein
MEDKKCIGNIGVNLPSFWDGKYESNEMFLRFNQALLKCYAKGTPHPKNSKSF